MNVLFAGLCAVLFATAPQNVADRFLEAFTRDDLGFVGTIVAAGEPQEWAELREAIETYDCITVRHAQWSVVSSTPDAMSLRIDLDAAGALKSKARPWRQLPRWWFIDARKDGSGWRIERAVTSEQRLAVAMAAATPDEAARMWIAAADVDPARALSAYANVPSVDASVARLDAAIPLAEASGDLASEMLMRRNRAHALLATSSAEALAAAREVVALARARGNPDVLASALLSAGYIEAMAGEYGEAAATYAAGADLHDRVEDPLPALKNLYMLGWLEGALGDQLHVLATAETLAGRAGTYGWEEGQENAMLQRAELHHELGNFAAARQVYRDAIRLSESRANAKLVAFEKFDLAGIELMEKRWDAAIELLRAVLAGHPEPRTLAFAAHSRLVTGLMGKEAYAEAEEVLRGAEAFVRTEHTGETALQEAILRLHWSDLRLGQGRYEEAIPLAREALATKDLPAKDDTRLMLFGARHVLGKALRAAGHPAEAIAALRDAVALTEDVSRDRDADPLSAATYIEGNLLAYAELVDLLVEQKEVGEAWLVAERMKGRALRETIERGRIDLSASMSEDERGREESLVKRVEEVNRALFDARQTGGSPDVLQRQLAEARAELDRFRVEMRVKYPAVARRRVDDARALPAVPEDLAMIDYVVAEHDTIAFVVTSTAGASAIEAIRLPMSRDDVEREAAIAARLIAARSPRYRAEAERLYAALVAPLERFIGRKKTLCIIPDGALWTVPFQALPDREGRDLVERHAVFYAHSASLLANAARPVPSAGHELIAFGNPTIGERARSTLGSAFRDVALGPLADAETEVRALARLYPAERTVVHYRGAAREGAFKREAGDFAIIHIAAHALVDDRAPLYSAIVLAGNEAGEDGLLEAREVVDLPLDAELAVLSACETAAGKVRSGEGVVGLAWAFSAAGCPTTVVSQWRTESKATAKLMVELHRRLRAGDSIAEALRSAQLALRRTSEYRHPFYWAPFVVIGAGDRPLAIAPLTPPSALLPPRPRPAP